MSTILISALTHGIGCWLCVNLMLYLVFKPAQPVNIAGIKIQGAVPANFKNLSQKLADIIYQLILTHKENLKMEITGAERMDKLMPGIEAHIDFFLREKLPQSMPMVAMLIGDKTIGQIKEVFVSEIRVLFPQLITQYVDGLLEDERLYPVLTEKLQSASVYSYITSMEGKVKWLFSRIKWAALLFGLIYGLLIGLLTA